MRAGGVFAALAAICTILVALAGIRAAFSTVPALGLAWTWQVALALGWMLVVYTWTARLGIQTMASAIALSLGALAVTSLLYCIVAGDAYPNWPAGNVLFLTTACLGGVFLAGSLAYDRLAARRGEGSAAGRMAGVAAIALCAVIAIVLWMAGRRAGLTGLAAGSVFVVAMTWPRRVRPATVAAGIVLAAVVAAVLAAAVYRHGRWETVQYRLEMYKGSARMLVETPARPLVGIGPWHLAFELTARMRPLHAESPRLFHGGIEEYSHSEPLQALVELGLPLGLLYLAVPIGGLVGYARAWRHARGRDIREPRRHDTAVYRTRPLAVLGVGAGLAAMLAAETTSVGMRQPGVAMLVWTLVGIGWACGARAGGFGRLARWFQPAGWALAHRRARILGGAAAAAVGLAVLGLAWQSLVASGHLYQARLAFKRGDYAQANRLLNGPAHLPTPGAWMDWKYVRGLAAGAAMEQAQTKAEAAQWQAAARSILGELVDVCPAYAHAPAYLSMACSDWDARKAICERFLRYDPYDYEARVRQTLYPGVTPVEQLRAARLAIRNAGVTTYIAWLVGQAAKDPAAAQLLADWMRQAEQTLQQPQPGQWSDPLAFESLRLGIVLAAGQGRLAEARSRVDQAATLLQHLSGDLRRNRPGNVEMEIRLDQAWFAWLDDPRAGPASAESLERYLWDLRETAQDTYCARMAAHLAAMLRLAEGQTRLAVRDFLLADPAVPPQTIWRQQGLAYARLIALVGSRVPPQQVQAWAQRGTALLGEAAWKQAMDAAAARGTAPWWFGVLAEG